MRAAGTIAAAAHGVTPIGILTALAGGTAFRAEATVERPSNDALAAANHARSRIARLIIKIHPAASTTGNHGKLLFKMMCIARSPLLPGNRYACAPLLILTAEHSPLRPRTINAPPALVSRRRRNSFRVR